LHDVRSTDKASFALVRECKELICIMIDVEKMSRSIERGRGINLYNIRIFPDASKGTDENVEEKTDDGLVDSKQLRDDELHPCCQILGLLTRNTVYIFICCRFGRVCSVKMRVFVRKQNNLLSTIIK
jgi:hypothetical protein